MSKNNFLKSSSKVLLVPSLLGSFIPQNTKADSKSFVLAKEDVTRKKKVDNSSFFKDWAIILKSTFVSWWLNFRNMPLFDFFSKNKAEVQEKPILNSKVNQEAEKEPEDFLKLKESLKKEFDDKISFRPYEDGKIPGTVELHGGYELPFYIDVIDDKKAVIRIRNGGNVFFADEKDDQEAKTITEQFFDYCSTASKVLEQMEDLEKNGLFVKTVNKKSGCIFWEPTIRCKINLIEKHIGISKIHAIQYDPYTGNIYFVDTPHYNKILYQLHSGVLDLNVGKDYFGFKKESSLELFKKIISKIKTDCNGGGPFETTVYDDLDSYDE